MTRTVAVDAVILKGVLEGASDEHLAQVLVHYLNGMREKLDEADAGRIVDERLTLRLERKVSALTQR